MPAPEIINLAGSTINVGGDLLWMGTLEETLSLNPSAAWFLNVAGLSHIENAEIANCDASAGDEVIAYISRDEGGNNNVHFWFQPSLMEGVNILVSSWV